LYIQDKSWLSHGYKHWLINGKNCTDESDVDSPKDDCGENWTDESNVDAPMNEDKGYVNIKIKPASDEPLTGFSSRGGSDMVTNGILMWGNPFILTNPTNGEKVMISFKVHTLLYTHTWYSTIV